MIATVGDGQGMPSNFSSSSAMRSRDKAIRSLARSSAGGERGGVGLAFAEAGVEAEEAQDAKVVLGDALQRFADEADAARRDIIEAAEIIENLAAGGVGIERVDGEVAARGIFAPIVGEGDAWRGGRRW